MSNPAPAASSSYYRVPKFSMGDLEEVMRTFRPHDITDLSTSLLDEELPFFPFPDSHKPDGGTS